jgi:hypothetical protein
MERRTSSEFHSPNRLYSIAVTKVMAQHNSAMMELQERRAILNHFVEECGFDLVAVYTARKNEAKASKKIPLFKEKKTDILKNQNLTTEDYVKKIDAGFYDDGYGIILGPIRRGKYKRFKSCLVDIDKREGVEEFCDLGSKKTTIEEAQMTGSRRDLVDNIREGKNSVQEITSGPSKQD